MGSFMKKCSAVFVTMLALIAMAPVCAFAMEKYDINGNGVVNIVDAQIAYDISCGRLTDLSNYSDLQKAADVNGDGVVDASDALAIQRYALTGTTEEPVEKAPLTLDSYTVKGTTITASFTYTNMRDEASYAALDYDFDAYQDGYVLSSDSSGGDYYTRVLPGYQTKFTYSWTMKTEGDVTVKVTAYAWGKGKSIEQVLTVSGTSAQDLTSTEATAS